MPINLSPEERLFLIKVQQYSEINRRTDTLAKCLRSQSCNGGGQRWDESHTAFIGINLRARGFVTTFKDTGQYALWTITDKGRQAITSPQYESPVSAPAKVKYLVLDKDDNTYGSETSSYDEAEKAARRALAEDPDSVYTIISYTEVATLRQTVEVIKP